MRILTIFSFFLTVLLTGCRNNEEQTTENPPIEDTEVVNPEYGGAEDDIQLNKGDQWEVNRQTTEAVERMSRVLQNNSASTVEEYRELGDQLEEEKSRLESTLTLNEPYTQSLDTFLDRLGEKIDQLQEVASEEEGARLRSEIQEQLSSYSGYFRSE